MPKWKKKDLDFDAHQFDQQPRPQWLNQAVANGKIELHSDHAIVFAGEAGQRQRAELDDWLIMDAHGDYYVSPARLFTRLYEEKP